MAKITKSGGVSNVDAAEGEGEEVAGVVEPAVDPHEPAPSSAELDFLDTDAPELAAGDTDSTPGVDYEPLDDVEPGGVDVAHEHEGTLPDVTHLPDLPATGDKKNVWAGWLTLAGCQAEWLDDPATTKDDMIAVARGLAAGTLYLNDDGTLSEPTDEG